MKNLQIDINKKVYRSKRRTTVALTDIHIIIDRLGLYFIVGPSGSGKSTLLNCISGDDHDYDGQISGNNHVYYCRQQIDLLPELTTLDNLRLINDDLETINGYLQAFDVVDCKDKKIKYCSNGQQKRIQMIKALLIQPKLLLLDETTASLDHDHVVTMMKAIVALSRSAIVIMVTHDLALAQHYGSTIYQFEGGALIDKTINAPLTNDPAMMIKRSNGKRLKGSSLAWILTKAHWIYGLTTSLLILLSTLLVLTILTMVDTQDNTYRYQQAYQDGSNIIISQPGQVLSYQALRQTSSTVGNKAINQLFPNFYINFDFYDLDDINAFIDQNQSIYAVEAYYDGSYEFSPCSNDYSCSDINAISQHTNARQQEPAWYQLAFESTQIARDRPIFGPFIVEYSPQYISTFTDGSYRAIEIMHDQNSPESDDVIRPLQHRLHLYTLVNDYPKYLPLVAGRYPATNSEIVLDQRTSEWIMGLFGLTKDELIGFSLPISITTFDDIEIIYDPETGQESSAYLHYSTLNYTVVGISEYSNAHQYMGYVGGRIDDQYLFDINVIDPTNMKVEYVHFMVDPLMDATTLIDPLTRYFNPQFDAFIRYSDTLILDSDTTDYSKTQTYLTIASIGLTSLMVLLVGQCWFNHKKMKHTMVILKQNHYKPIALLTSSIMIPYGIMMLLAILVLIMVYPLLSIDLTMIQCIFYGSTISLLILLIDLLFTFGFTTMK